MAKNTEITKMNDGDLMKHVAEKREEVRAFRFQVAGSATRDVRKVRQAKKDIARALTERSRRSQANKTQA